MQNNNQEAFQSYNREKVKALGEGQMIWENEELKAKSNQHFHNYNNHISSQYDKIRYTPPKLNHSK